MKKQPTESFDMVVFGGNGDLSLRKLIPALFQCDCRHRFPDEFRILAIGRSTLSDEEFRAQIKDTLLSKIESKQQSCVDEFIKHIHYLKLDATHADDFTQLKQWLDKERHAVRVFYLATSPTLFSVISHNLAISQCKNDQTRIVLEKPLGHDLASARKINHAVGCDFEEHEIYRIDHYLGKETVQNLMAIRFGNSVFEPLWNRSSIDYVEITVAEDLGIDNRGSYYDKSGALRDMVQNHLMQLLCLTAMEAPSSSDGDAVRDEKLKVLRSLRPMEPHMVHKRIVRGQYDEGNINGEAVKSYHQEKNIDKDSITETFVALKVEIENWRWAGVPFYLRTGKRLAQKCSEIVINFRPIPHAIFDQSTTTRQNRLIMRLQPNEGIVLEMNVKRLGEGMRLQTVPLDLQYNEAFKDRNPDAYERLLVDVINGKLTLFMRRDELDAAWQWASPILDEWEENPSAPKKYKPGSWGPAAATALIIKDDHIWSEEH